ncbi:MAG: YtxH domain-containing protein [Candidatus Limnocylindria bacterium]
MKIAIRFFFVGLAVGVLLAPRSGVETRRLVRERADRILNDVLDAATLGTVDTGDQIPPDEAEAPRRTTRASNSGSSASTTRSTRSRAASTGTGAAAG